MAAAIPSSEFDPLVYLNSEPPDLVQFDAEPDPSFFTDDLEALEEQRLEIAERNRQNRVVIQSRTWKLSDVFRSDEDIRPVTPTKSHRRLIHKSIISDTIIPSSPPVAIMPLISSPPTHPAGPPLVEARKRKSEVPQQIDEPKRQKVVGGFVDDDDDDNDQIEALREAYEAENVCRMPKVIGGFDDDEDALAEMHANYSPYSAPFREQQEKLEKAKISRRLVPGPFIEEDDDYNSVDGLDGTQVESDFTLLQSMSKAATTETIPSTTESSNIGFGGASLSGTTIDISPKQGFITIKTCAGKIHRVISRQATAGVSYERLIASRSTQAPGKAQRSYYGIEIHKLLDEAARQRKDDADRAEVARQVQPSIEPVGVDKSKEKSSNLMWTEKYRARKFTDLIGDERTHRSVLRWLKSWDHIVFPGLANPKKSQKGNDEGERAHRKILMLTGPPGLGKTTLAHVCARQAGYEVLEINASDDRSKDVVKGRIKDSVGTENVKSVGMETDPHKASKAARPVCVVVDEVDGVVGGSGAGGEGGFIKALIDLVMTDQKNSSRANQGSSVAKKGKGDNFRLLRPMILICNDVYHPSLRPLRTANIAEVIHVRHVPLENVIQRMKMILGREKVAFDNDGVRRLCEASWGITAKKDRTDINRGTAEGDIRSVLVSAEWVARKLRATTADPRLTRGWLEKHILDDSQRDGSSKGLGRGGIRDVVNRVFVEGAGFPAPPVGADSFMDPFEREKTKTPVGVADLRRRHAITKLREMVETTGDYDRCITDCFIAYPTRAFQDDTFLSKPNSAYDWLHFHDMASSKVYTNQDWEMNPYLSQSVVAFHHLFASSKGSSVRNNKMVDDNESEEEHPFSGPRADFAAFEALKQNKSILVGFQSTFSAPLLRLFRSLDCVATDLVPSLMRILSPDVKPVVVRGSEQKSVASVRKESEKVLVRAAVRVMVGLRVTYEKARVENEGVHGGWVYRLEPPIDTLIGFSKIKGTILDAGGSGPVRYAVRQVLDQEYRKETMRKQSEYSQAKYGGSSSKGGDPNEDDDKENGATKAKRDNPGAKRDFFGRIINESLSTTSDKDNHTHKRKSSGQKQGQHKVWVTFHEGFSNAVRKPISLSELLAEL
ncbi:hypothetical protein BGW36DRAFT_311722 [Talaromyces proteolyticus]|uniref:AAA+ ATPase domain-containing protein n=1 Tax=Talaromyces proteolyticus TaxID=1131652 RepID=A0AAD4L4P8_9EURO|nr:uncharacterized protein BGW36DRAFT_311722 [Talaromyces proteolyticus]KAH8705922.1 hypothetical protein BGW36DRAFT_311722 [Talaromyces proteolyticus]